jgi:hypothetical protein
MVATLLKKILNTKKQQQFADEFIRLVQKYNHTFYVMSVLSYKTGQEI